MCGVTCANCLDSFARTGGGQHREAITACILAQVKESKKRLPLHVRLVFRLLLALASLLQLDIQLWIGTAKNEMLVDPSHKRHSKFLFSILLRVSLGAR